MTQHRFSHDNRYCLFFTKDTGTITGVVFDNFDIVSDGRKNRINKKSFFLSAERSTALDNSAIAWEIAWVVQKCG